MLKGLIQFKREIYKLTTNKTKHKENLNSQC